MGLYTLGAIVIPGGMRSARTITLTENVVRVSISHWIKTKQRKSLRF